MTKILNTTIEKAQKQLSHRKLQRLSIDLKCRTNLEVLIIPLGDNWEFDRMTGTDKGFFAIGVTNYGFYQFKLDGSLGAGYVATKLSLPFKVAKDLTDLLNKFKIKFYDAKK